MQRFRVASREPNGSSIDNAIDSEKAGANVEFFS